MPVDHIEFPKLEAPQGQQKDQEPVYQKIQHPGTIPYFLQVFIHLAKISALAH